jgi:hypothetical protein
MTITYALDENNTTIGPLVSRAIWKAYKLGLENGNLDLVSFSGCEKDKNFWISLEIEEMM